MSITNLWAADDDDRKLQHALVALSFFFSSSFQSASNHLIYDSINAPRVRGVARQKIPPPSSQYRHRYEKRGTTNVCAGILTNVVRIANKNRIANCILVLKYLSLFYVSFHSGRAIAVLKRAIFTPIYIRAFAETAFRLKRIFAKVHLRELYDVALPRLLGQDLVLYGFYATVIPTFLQSRTKYRLFR